MHPLLHTWEHVCLPNPSIREKTKGTQCRLTRQSATKTSHIENWAELPYATRTNPNDTPDTPRADRYRTQKSPLSCYGTSTQSWAGPGSKRDELRQWGFTIPQPHPRPRATPSAGVRRRASHCNAPRAESRTMVASEAMREASAASSLASLTHLTARLAAAAMAATAASFASNGLGAAQRWSSPSGKEDLATSPALAAPSAASSAASAACMAALPAMEAASNTPSRDAACAATKAASAALTAAEAALRHDEAAAAAKATTAGCPARRTADPPSTMTTTTAIVRNRREGTDWRESGAKVEEEGGACKCECVRGRRR
ncbi:hypothetical protein BU14_0147s0026 [Porphyra umbilicalis]|uniref:Uncharacterized protein n=1 Tax=Porphyra umbilicalis TaxID=2786 RepID=A0A1X6P9C9_PORUM|nr:hypothetical protein BU14_0147s0026 [Porphyra umbilicalis]|eukprot:OSX77501.1 hypothetical protein BU14_0147s0026 [Porphyra umbilicalis]